MSDRVVFTPEAQADLEELYDYVTDASSADIAARFTDAIITFCEQLAVFPNRGRAREDIRPGLRIIGYRRRAVIAFTANDDVVAILGVYYGGRDYERILEDTDI